MRDSRTILVIEDEPDLREPNAVALAQAGYRVVEAASWDEAYDLVPERDQIALILTDLAMPGRAGVARFAELHARHRRPPVIVLSAYPRMMRMLDGVLDGVVRWIEKPVDVSTVVNAVGEALDDHRP